MKYISAYILLLVCLFFTSRVMARQQQQDPTGLNQEIDFHIDKLGDATMEVRIKMNAMQWQSFKASPVASNPTIFKRDMERQMAAYIIDDVKTNLNEGDRTSLTTLSMTCANWSSSNPACKVPSILRIGWEKFSCSSSTSRRTVPSTKSRQIN